MLICRQVPRVLDLLDPIYLPVNNLCSHAQVIIIYIMVHKSQNRGRTQDRQYHRRRYENLDTQRSDPHRQPLCQPANESVSFTPPDVITRKPVCEPLTHRYRGAADHTASSTKQHCFTESDCSRAYADGAIIYLRHTTPKPSNQSPSS